MKISQVSIDALMALSYEEKWQLICGSIKDDNKSAKIAILLGSAPEEAIKRAHAAARLYHSGRIEYIVPSGGVKWKYNDTEVTEANLMAKILIDDLVPESAVLVENEARTTKENMLYSTILINRAFTFNHIDHIIIVTSTEHMQRSLGLASALLPRKVSVSAFPSPIEGSLNEWLSSKNNRAKLDRAIQLTKGLVDHHIIDDIEIL